MMSRVPALAELVADLIAKGNNAPGIARRLHLTDSYVAKLHRIARDIPPHVLRDWRAARRPLSVTAMLKVATSADPITRYRELQVSSLDRRGTQSTLERARECGRIFARLDAFGFPAPMPPYNECISRMFPRLESTFWVEAATEVERGWHEERAFCDDECDSSETE